MNNTAKKILIIDDDAGVRFTLKKILVSAGYEVLEAPDGRRGIELFCHARPDLVITDIIMPEAEGLEVIRDLRARNRACPVIAISGGGRIDKDQLLTWATKFGATVTLAKPFTAQALSDAVARCLS